MKCAVGFYAPVLMFIGRPIHIAHSLQHRFQFLQSSIIITRIVGSYPPNLECGYQYNEGQAHML